MTTRAKALCGAGLTLALSCTSPPDSSEAPPNAITAARQADESVASAATALQWCTTSLADVHWEGLPQDALEVYLSASSQCQRLLAANNRLLSLGMLSFALVGKKLPIVKPPESINEQFALLQQLGIDQQRVVNYAVTPEACSTDTEGTALLRIGFTEGGLARFAPDVDSALNRMIESGARVSSVAGGTAVSVPSKKGSPCETTLIVGDDELLVHEGPAQTELEPLLAAARSHAALQPSTAAAPEEVTQ